MSSYATVYLSDGRDVCSFRNGVDQLSFVLFTREDRVELYGQEAWRLKGRQYPGEAVDGAYLFGFRTFATWSTARSGRTRSRHRSRRTRTTTPVARRS